VNPDTATLAIRIRAELGEVAQVVERAQRLLAKAQKDNDYYDGVALNLHSFYTAIERILEDIAREVDGAAPSGPQWHRDLLSQLSVEFPGIRPSVLQHSSRACLDEYRGLRHVVRNVYTFNLNPARLQELVAMLPACYADLVKDLDLFCFFLENCTPPN
jgi:hypothetical protein